MIQPYLAADILPDVPGCAPGVVGLDPLRLQCAQCGAIEAPARPVLMRTIFHNGADWRSCPTCREALKCCCDSCRWEFRHIAPPQTYQRKDAHK